LDSYASIFERLQKEGRKSLLESEAKKICSEYRIPVTKFKVVESEVDAINFAEKIGYPVVLKIVSPDIIHKSDVGGVFLNLKNREELRDAYKRLFSNVIKNKPNATLFGVIVQEMVLPSTEVIVGAIKDPHFGHALMFGLGGVFVELLKDVAFRIAPISVRDAKEMISEIKGYPVLTGYRGQPIVDIDTIVEILLNTSRLVMDFEKIKELDLNPVVVYEKGAKVVDARILLE
jgi:acetyl-CoA synthetase (ADP-forming)